MSKLRLTDLSIDAGRRDRVADVWTIRRNGSDHRQRLYKAVRPASLRRAQRAQIALVER